MFQKILGYIRRVVSKIFTKNTIAKAAGRDLPISTEMSVAIDEWRHMYEDIPHWLSETVKSAGIPSAIASEFARLVTLEMETEITAKVPEEGADTPKENTKSAFLNQEYQRALGNIRNQVEYGCALGGLMMKPYIDGDKIAVDFVQADAFFPTEFDSSGNITGCIFVEQKQEGSYVYTRLEKHSMGDVTKENGEQTLGTTIQNVAFKAHEQSEGLGDEIPLTEVEEWASLEPEGSVTDIERPLFSYFKMPVANNIDSTSPLGISVFGRAKNRIKEADKQYSRFLWEFEGGEMAVDASMDLFSSVNAEELPKGKDRLYRKLDLNMGEGSNIRDQIQTFAPQLRDESFYNGFNRLLQRIEFDSGLAYGTISDVQTISKTAEEIKTSKQRSYAHVSDIQKQLEKALEDLIYAMDVWTNYMDVELKGEYEVSFNWDDSLIVDMGFETTIMLQEVASSIISPQYYLKKRYGATDEQIKEMMGTPVEPLEEKEFDTQE